ncbi:hypothetical protein C8A03DRAFT_38855 [Achaetomium macrosporum]|uniref:Uncharacterized protein n=1 Tax=Achaetomium macrosporum TaxID=79813 RepID=A0AAN7HA48_9PEZI|nr:hypothetical protein C8A03DRAFT_38855 [Achaetomium macrosporum]
MNNVDPRELRATARAVIRTLWAVPNSKYSDLRIAVIGGLARIHHLPGRATHDANFVVETSEMAIPPNIQQDLIDHCRPNYGHFSYDRTLFYHHYITPQGVEGRCRVDFFPSACGPYLPAAALRVRDISTCSIPYISREDLIFFKIYAYVTRHRRDKEEVDAVDARDLLAMNPAPLTLTKDQRKVVREGLEAVMSHFQNLPQSWWTQRLGLP